MTLSKMTNNDDTGWRQLAVAIVLDAVDVYKSNEYPSNVGTDFSTPRMEALTFLHSNLYESMCDYAGADPRAVRDKHGIPQPSCMCACESCRTDYRPEAYILAAKRPSVRIRFSNGSKHSVYWKKGKIYSVIPVNKEKSTNPRQYLKER
jgi:hypothetical protein